MDRQHCLRDRVITLRRMKEERKKEGAGKIVGLPVAVGSAVALAQSVLAFDGRTEAGVYRGLHKGSGR
jgi:hypothetical protein